ncbi:TPR domain protein, putative component of TonB system, partial [uncultured Gammaproteobacteria bacterium]
NKLPSGGGFVYRGQSDESWGLASTYYRRFNLNKSGDKQQPTQEQFQDYHENLIKDAKSYHYHKEKLSNLELLLELQHYGAATGLIDFSRDFLVALWFACNSNKDKNGSVFALNISDIDKFTQPKDDKSIFSECDKLQFIDSNFKSNNRIFAQKGVFVFGNQTINNTKAIPILQDHKEAILQELSDIFSIDEKSLFQDIYGFSMVNDVKHPIYEKTVEEYLLEGNQDFYKSKFDKAIEAYEKAIKIKPNYEAYYNIGLAYTSSNKFKEAIKAYEKAIEINPDYDTAYYNMGIAYAKLDKFKEAIEAFKKVIEIKPDFDKAYYSMGIAYDILNEFDKALEAYEKAIEIKPDFDEAYYSMGLAYVKSGKFEKAIGAFKKAIEIKPDFDEAYYSMGIAYTMLNEFDKALEAYEKSIVLNSALIRKLNIHQWYPLEQWINNLTDTDKKQQYLQTLKRLKDE